MFTNMLVRGEGMPTFEQRMKQAWKNIDQMKHKDNDKINKN